MQNTEQLYQLLVLQLTVYGLVGQALYFTAGVLQIQILTTMLYE